MKRPISLTLRLTLWFSTVAMFVLLAFGWIVERSIESHFDSGDINELKMITQAVEKALLELKSNDDIVRIEQRFNDILVGHHSALLHIIDSSGKYFYASPGSDLSLMPTPPSIQLDQGVLQTWSHAEQNYRVFVQQITGLDNNSYTVVVAIAIDFHLKFLESFHHTLWLMVIVGIAIMALMSWIAVRQGHRPLHHMVDQISGINASELNIRLDPGIVPAELTALAMSFNALLQRMEDAFNRLSNFSADIAHELRTPVTNLMTQTQVALSHARTATEYREILYSNMEEYERMAQMIGDMLFLAKTDNRLNSLNIEDVDLKSEVRNLFDYYEAWAEESHVTLILEGQAHVQGDPLMLRRALSNLLSNAIRHTSANNCVNVMLNRDKKGVTIVVQNPGSLVSPAHLEKIFDRFYRIDPSRQRSSEGAGLGLAIVKSIIESHGGKIVVTSTDANTEFRISLPA